MGKARGSEDYLKLRMYKKPIETHIGTSFQDTTLTKGIWTDIFCMVDNAALRKQVIEWNIAVQDTGYLPIIYWLCRPQTPPFNPGLCQYSL